MAQVPITDVSFVGDGVTDIYDFTFPYLKQEEVFVSVDGVNVTFDWLSNSSVQLHAVPADGAVVIVYRNTDASDVRYLFNSGVPLKPAYIDANARQLLYALQEGVNSFAEVGESAADAQAAAQAAQEAATAASNAAFEAAANLTRSIRVPLTDPALPILPDVADRAGKLLSFDMLGNPSVSVPSSGSAEALALDLADSSSPTKGANMIGYDGSTVNAALNDLRAALVAGGSGYRTLTSFGVVGDGVTDDSAAMLEVAAYTGVVVGASHMVVRTDGFTITGGLQLDMRGGTLLLNNAGGRFTIGADDVSIMHTVFDADGKNVNTCLLFIPAGTTDYYINRCTFRNIVGIAGSANQYGILARPNGATGYIGNCVFMDISNRSDPAPVSGFCGGIFVLNEAGGARQLVIENILLQNIYTTNFAADINNTDADGIRIAGSIPATVSNIVVRNVRAVDVQKSAIKVTGTAGFQIANVDVYNNRNDIAMIAAIRVLNCASFDVSGLTAQGNMSCLVSVGGQSGTVRGCSYGPINTARDLCAGGMVQVMGSDAVPSKYLTLTGIVGYNVDMALDYETFGTTLSTLFSNITMRDITAVAGSTSRASRIRNAVNCVLDNVQLIDPEGVRVTAVEFTNSRAITMRGCRFESRRHIVTFAKGVGSCGSLDFDECTFHRPDSESAANFAMLPLRHDDATTMDAVRLRNCRFRTPGYTTASAQTILLCNLTNSQLTDLDIQVSSAGTTYPPFFISGVFAGCRIGGLRIGSAGTQALATGLGWAVELLSGSAQNSITDVLGRVSRGVVLRTGSANNLVDSIAARATTVSDAGTANTVGTQATIP